MERALRLIGVGGEDRVDLSLGLLDRDPIGESADGLPVVTARLGARKPEVSVSRLDLPPGEFPEVEFRR